jgi:hypothetical protein
VLQGVQAHSIGRICLYVDTLDTTTVVELVDVVRCQQQLEGAVHIGQRQTHRLSLHAVNFHLQLRCVRQRVRAGAVKLGALACLGEQGTHGLRQFLAGLAGARLQIHVHAAELAEAADGRQVDHENLRIGDAVQNTVGLRDQLHRGF